MHNIVFSRLAEEDLYNLFETIAQDKPLAAVSYIDKLEEHIELLKTNPSLGIECRHKKIDKKCRVLIFEEYLIFYTLQEQNIIHIVRILSAKMNYQETL